MPPSPLADFLDHPGLPGPFGGIMDEYARAAGEFCRVVEALDPASFAAERTSKDPDAASLRAVCLHAWAAARRYADYIRRARGLPHDDRFTPDPAALPTPSRLRPLLAEALRYTEGALEGLRDDDGQAAAAITFPVRWGPVYDPEMILEHAIVHLLRHRRQVERWEGAGR